MWATFKKFDLYLDKCIAVLSLLLLVVILRLPNLFEPYWYGDEAIYLTLGTAMRNGLRLYAEIIDHKTPLIYYLAMTPSQLWFRILNIAWMLTATVAFYALARRVIGKNISSFIASVVFVLLTTLPAFEGNLPNGELFIIGWVLVASWLITRTKYWSNFVQNTVDTQFPTAYQNAALFGAGILLGLGILTKVPGLFDATAFFTIAWFTLSNNILGSSKWDKKFLNLAQTTIISAVIMGIGLLIPILLSIVYFIVRGSGQAYLDFGLLYNFRYANSWQLEFTSPLIQFMFSMPGKFLMLVISFITLTLGTKLFKPSFQFAMGWAALALFASLLSNRPYPHYFQQVMPALALVIGLCLAQIENWRTLNKHTLVSALFQTGFATGFVALCISILYLLNAGLYPTLSYYSRFIKLATGQITAEQYRNSFDGLMADNYAISPILRSMKSNRLFIWGTNPTLYALTQTVPTGRFTVSFHIKDFDAYDETLRDIKTHEPEYIVVMKSETGEFPGFYEYLTANYMPNDNYQTLTLWRKL